MESYLCPQHYDLVTPDGAIEVLHPIDDRRKFAIVRIDDISPAFIGYTIDPSLVFFNMKSTLAQLGLNGIGREYTLEKKHNRAIVKVELIAMSDLGAAVLDLLSIGAYIGKLFAADDRRRVRDPDYLMRMFGRSDREGRPLLSLGGLEGSNDLILEKIEGRTVAFLSLKSGAIEYEPSIGSFFPTLTKALNRNFSQLRRLLHLHHRWVQGAPRIVKENDVLLVRTAPLHVRTVYGKVVGHLLPQGYTHMTASVLQPDTFASGDIYELYGASTQAIDDVPLEFYTLEPHKLCLS